MARIALSLAIALAGCGGATDPFALPPSQIQLSSDSLDTNAYAFFSNSGDGCSDEGSSGPCTFYRCGVVAATAGRGAGTITVSSPSVSITMTPGAGQSYSGQGASWMPGEAIQLAASGADVPAFAGTLSGAGPIAVTRFAVDDDHGIDRARGTSIDWTGRPGDRLRLEFQVGNTGPGDPLVELLACDFTTPGTSGVPAELFQKFQASTVSVLSASRTSSVLQAGDLAIGLSSNWWVSENNERLTRGNVPLR